MMQPTCHLMVNTVFPMGQHLRHSFPEVCLPRWSSDHFKSNGTPYQTNSGKLILAANTVNYDATKEVSQSHLMHTSLPFQEMNQLLGIPHSRSDWQVKYRRDGSETTEWEAHNLFVYRGLLAPNISNIADLESQNKLYDSYSFYERSKKSKQLRIDSLSHWWKHLDLLIRRHYDAVGIWYSDSERDMNVQAGEYFRNVSVVAQYFVEFEKTIEEYTYDSALIKSVKAQCPSALEDIFAIFIEMEANKVNLEYCPRCSQPYSSTRYCGQGIRFTPYHKYQGIWNPHQMWSREWNEAICNRAEALFAKSIEHPIFGGPYHTQRQVNALMRTYEVTHQRGRANTFMSKIRGSMAYQLGVIEESAELRASFESLLDKTRHPILYTHEKGTTNRVITNPYTNHSSLNVPQSIKKLRIDIELDRFRREQREEGVVRIPPKGWNLKMNELPDYQYTDSTTPDGHRITNWRDVKRGLEDSFLRSRRLPDEAYIDRSKKDGYKLLRRVQFHERKVKELHNQELSRTLDMENTKERCLMKDPFFFPDETSYRWFESNDLVVASLIDRRYLSKDVHNVRHGNVISFQRYTFENESEVPFLGKHKVNIKNRMCEQFGFLYGSTFPHLKSSLTLMVVGVDTESFHLLAATSSREILEIGRTIKEVTSFMQQYEWDLSKAAIGTHPDIEKHRTHQEEFRARIVGVRAQRLWIQYFPDEGVASPLGDYVVEKSIQVLDKRRVSPQEPPSWKIAFRNNWAEVALEDATEAPWRNQPVAPLICDRMTPKRKVFNYSQHNENNDFVTKEYYDRLRSKQFFADPKSFQVLPDAYEKAPNFSGKWESAYSSGLPTVDRKELINGWRRTIEPAESEVQLVEQAIRDISGTRPGNYYKRVSELAKFNINEEWWNVVPYWEYRNFLEKRKRKVEQRIIDHTALPFGGSVPVLGAAGIGERIKYVTDQLEKGFGNGPTGFSPTSQLSHTNTLNYETQAQEHLNTSHVLLKLFQQKLTKENMSEPQFIWSTGIRMKEAMLALENWVKYKKSPGVALLRMLGVFLRDEVATYNKDLPPGLGSLKLPESDVLCNHFSVGDVWVERDLQLVLLSREEEKDQKDDGDVDLVAQEGFIQYKYVQSKLGSRADPQSSSKEDTASLRIDNSALEKWCRQVYIDDFILIMSKYINVSIPKSFLKAVRNSKEVVFKEFRNSNRWISSESLKFILMESQVSVNDAAHILLRAPDIHHVIHHGQLVKKSRHSLSSFLPPKGDAGEVQHTYYHVASLLKWNGVASDKARSVRRQGESTNAAPNVVKQRSLLDVLSKQKPSTDIQESKGSLKLRDVLCNYATYFGEAAAMDRSYKIEANLGNRQLFLEFARFVHPLVASRDDYLSMYVQESFQSTELGRKLYEIYADYTEGKWIPSVSETHFLITKLLRNISDSISGRIPHGDDFSKLVVASRNEVLAASPAPMYALPFDFESIQAESQKSRERFESLGIPDQREEVQLSNLWISQRDRKVDYKSNYADSCNGHMAYGDVDITEVDGTFIIRLKAGLDGQKELQKLMVDTERLLVFVKNLINRHLPLLSVYYQLWRRAIGIAENAQESLADGAEEFRQIFEIHKTPHVSDDFSKADGTYQDDINL